MAEREKIGVQISPVEGNPKQVDLIAVTEYRRRFPYIGAISNMLWQRHMERLLKIGGGLVLTATAITELSKPLAPLISSDLAPLSTYPVLEQLSKAAENPIGIGVLAAIGAYALLRSADRGRDKLNAIARELHHVQISPIDSHKPPDQ